LSRPFSMTTDALAVVPLATTRAGGLNDDARRE